MSGYIPNVSTASGQLKQPAPPRLADKDSDVTPVTSTTDASCIDAGEQGSSGKDTKKSKVPEDTTNDLAQEIAKLKVDVSPSDSSTSGKVSGSTDAKVPIMVQYSRDRSSILHNIILVPASATLEQLERIISESLRKDGLQEEDKAGRPTLIERQGNVGMRLTAHWGNGDCVAGDFFYPLRTEITEKNVTAVLSYLHSVAGYNLVDVVFGVFEADARGRLYVGRPE